MIKVTKLNGRELVVNADLIEFIEATPDTVITLADGRKMVVAEAPHEIVERSKMFRASVIAVTDQLRQESAPALSLLRSDEE